MPPRILYRDSRGRFISPSAAQRAPAGTVRLGVVVDGSELKLVAKMLQDMAKRGLDLTPMFLGPIEKSMHQFYRAMFDTRGSIGGERWASLRPATIRYRQLYRWKGKSASHPLWDTGKTKASLVKVGPNSVREVTPSSYSRGTAIPHIALYHQRGYVVKRWGKIRFSQKPGKPKKGWASMRRVPPRRVVPLTLPRHLVAAWEGMVADHLVAAGANPNMYVSAGAAIHRFGR